MAGAGKRWAEDGRLLPLGRSPRLCQAARRPRSPPRRRPFGGRGRALPPRRSALGPPSAPSPLPTPRQRCSDPATGPLPALLRLRPLDAFPRCRLLSGQSPPSPPCPGLVFWGKPFLCPPLSPCYASKPRKAEGSSKWQFKHKERLCCRDSSCAGAAQRACRFLWETGTRWLRESEFTGLLDAVVGDVRKERNYLANRCGFFILKPGKRRDKNK